MKITIGFIAEQSGVSKSTVSRYLNGGYVSEELKSIIAYNIKKYHYVPNQFAQSLKAKESMMVGVVIPRVNSYAAQETLMGIETMLESHHYKMMMSSSSLSLEKELEAIQLFDQQKVDGIILLATQITKEHTNLFNRLSVPIIIIGQEAQGQSYFVYNDHSAGYIMAEHAYKQGYMTWDYIGVGESDRAVGILRKQGMYLMAKTDSDIKVHEHKGDFSFATSERIAEEILSDNLPHCIICATDTIALAVMKVAKRLNKDIPSDVQIIGSGNYDITTLSYPELSSVSFPYRETGFDAAKALLELMHDSNKKFQVVVDVSLVPRGSL